MASTTQNIGLKTYDISTDNFADFTTGTSQNMVAIDKAISDKVKLNGESLSNVNFIGDGSAITKINNMPIKDLELNESVNVIKNDMYPLSAIEPETIYNGKAFFIQSGALNSVVTATYNSKRYDVSNIDKVYLTFDTNQRTTPLNFVSFTDSGTNILGYALEAINPTSYVDEEVIVPKVDNIKYMYVVSFATGTPLIAKNSANIINNLARSKEVAEVKTQIDEIKKEQSTYKVVTKTRNILDVTQLIKDKAISYNGDKYNYSRSSSGNLLTPLIHVKQNEIYKSAFKYSGIKTFKYVLFNENGERIEFDDNFHSSFVVNQDGWVALSFSNSENIPEAIQLVDSLDDVPNPESVYHYNYKYNPYYHEEKPLDVIDKTGGFTAIFHKIGIIGDSLASGAIEYAGTGVSGMAKDMPEYSWGQSIARSTGCEVIQFSKGGAYVHDDNWFNSFKASVTNNPCTAYIIMIGSNDQSFTTTNLGTPEDIKENYTENPNTFYGKYAQTIQFIKTIQPKAKIFVCTLPYARIYESTQTAIRYMSTHFTNTYLIDLRTYSKPPAFSYKDTNITGAFHLNTIGYQKVAWEIMSYIDYIVRHNEKDFIDVQLIGTNYELAKDGGDAS